MNKKLLAAAIAAAVVAAPAAFADSTVYGKFHTSIDMNDFDYQGDSKDVDNYSMESRASRLGFKGSEDLGNGLKAIYQVELSVQTDGNDGATGQDGGDGWGGQRNTFIGLAGGWGTLLVGRHDTPMKVAFYGAGTEVLGDSIIDLNLGNGLKSPKITGELLNSLDPNYKASSLTIGSTGKSKSSPIGVFSEYRADNAIAYISPNFGGFTFAGAVIPGEDGNGGLEGDGFADHYSLGAMWSGAGFKVSGGYQDTEAGDTNQKTWQLGASYTMNAFMIGAQYEDTENFGFLDGDDYTAWAITGKWTFGNNAISAVYTDSELDAATDSLASNLDTSGWGLAAEHNFSKRTKLYAAYADDTREYDVGEDDDVSVFSIGMIHNF